MPRHDGDRTRRQGAQGCNLLRPITGRDALHFQSLGLRERRESVSGPAVLRREQVRHSGIGQEVREPLRARLALLAEPGVARVVVALLRVPHQDHRDGLRGRRTRRLLRRRADVLRCSRRGDREGPQEGDGEKERQENEATAHAARVAHAVLRWSPPHRVPTLPGGAAENSAARSPPFRLRLSPDAMPDAPPAPPPDPERTLGKVLVVRTGAIGDVVNALVFAAALRDEDPGVEIGWVAHPLVVPLLEGNPVVDRVHVWPRGGGLRGLRELVRAVRAERYDIAVDLQRIQKSALVARASGAARVVGHDRARTKELAWLWTRERLRPGDPRGHMVSQYLEFARHLGLRAESPRWPLPDLEAARAAVEELLAPGPSPADPRPLVALNLGASKPPNRWPPARFAELADELEARRRVRLVLTGGPGDADARDEVLATVRDSRPLDLVGRTGLLELAALFEHAACVVTADTGPMHIAVAVGARVVAVFGPADPRRTGPYGDGHIVLRDPPWDGQPAPEAQPRSVSAQEAAFAVERSL